MYITFKNRQASLYNDTKQIVRQFRTNSDIVNAQVSGSDKNAVIALTMKNGKTVLYRSDGTIIRR